MTRPPGTDLLPPITCDCTKNVELQGGKSGYFRLGVDPRVWYIAMCSGGGTFELYVESGEIYNGDSIFLCVGQTRSMVELQGLQYR